MAWDDMTQLTNCYGWFKPESLASSYADGDPISSWADSSGNSRDLSQATSSNQPLAVANAVNGYMAADFVSSDSLYSGSYTQSGDVVVSLVFSIDVLKNFNGCFNVNANPNGTWSSSGSVHAWVQHNIYSNGGHFVQSMTGAYNSKGSQYFSGSLFAANNYYLHTFSLCSKGMQLKIDGRHSNLDYVRGNFASPPSGTAYMWMGKTYNFLDGKIAEVVVYDAVDTDFSEVAWVEGYLADKYAITLANGHLFRNEPPANAPTTYNPTGGGGATVHPLYAN